MANGSGAIDPLAHARAAFRRGSKSFAAAALLFDRRTRRDATLLYAWCRYCDDVIDGQTLGRGRVVAQTSPIDRLDALVAQTRAAFAGAPTRDPVFAGLQQVVARCAIPERLAIAHLDGFRMDVEGRTYDTIEQTLDYCYHVAGVVGLMMAHLMGVRDPATLERAADLGIAFQLTNITRDLVDDARCGRVYVPRAWLDAAGIDAGAIADPRAAPALAEIAVRLLELSRRYDASARIGIGALPLRSAWAIATARVVYQQIGAEVLRRGEQAWRERVRTTKLDKTRLIARGAIDALGRHRLSEPDSALAGSD